MKALLVIDMIKHDVDKLWNRDLIVANQVKLMHAFKESQQLVVLVSGGLTSEKNPVMIKLWGDESKDENGTPLTEEEISVIPELKEFDYRIKKSEYSAFYETELEDIFKKNGVDEIYLAGIYTGCCIYFTGADAAMRKIQPYIISDAVASPTEQGTKENIHRFEIFMGPAITTEQLISEVAK